MTVRELIVKYTLPENPVDGQMCYIAPPESGTIITTLIIQCTGSQIFAGLDQDKEIRTEEKSSHE